MSEQERRDELGPTGDIPILHGPPTQEELRLQLENEQLRAKRESEAEFQRRQIALTESGIRLTQANLVITWVLAIFTAVSAGAAIYQGYVSRLAAGAAKSAAQTASQTLQEMKSGQGAQDTHTLAQEAIMQSMETGDLAKAAKQSADAQISAARSTASAAEATNESLTDVQAAFLAFPGTIPAERQIENKTVTSLSLTIPWTNLGSTAARNVDTRVNWLAVPTSINLPDQFPFSDIPAALENRQSEIGRNMSAYANLTIPAHFFDEARKKRVRIYVWGWATYNDVFKGTQKHLSEFCDELSDVKITQEDAASPSAEFNWKLQLCKTHNCYEGDCSDFRRRVWKGGPGPAK